MRKDSTRRHHLRNLFIFAFSCCIILTGIGLIWISTFKIPSLDTIEARKVTQSTKIYDSTGKILLYDVFQNTKRTLVPFEDISPYIKDATLSIEDKEFYTHHGIKPLSIIRALFIDITTLHFTQGASTITQQVVKNSILTGDKTATRKLKELVLALKLEKVLNKEQIFSMYLNEIPYGGSIYGVQEASRDFFGKDAKDVTLAEAAYLASLPNAPSYYSPYGTNKNKLDERKNLVLKEMFKDGKITEIQYNEASKEQVVFLPKTDKGIKAPHFVMYVKDYLEQKYGTDVLEGGGLKVTTTLNYDLQAKAESFAKQFAIDNKKNFNAENLALIAIDPKTGGILTMVGSRDYFDKDLNGNFNVALAHRQPGSTFKPFAYAEAFIKGFTPDTVLFDVPTQFSTACQPDDMSDKDPCYAPSNYDDKFRGPITMRNALAQSINVPSVKVLYLAGVKDSIDLATNMGITGLSDQNTYGLTLVLGGGEVTLLDMTSAYGVFANDGVRNPYISVLKVEDKDGNILEEAKQQPTQILDSEITRKVTDILSDSVARAPLYGPESPVNINNRDVAVKTGTTNDYKDAWIIGYTPSIVVGAWAGNNNNTAMIHKVAGYIVAPFWRAVMDEALKTVPIETFNRAQKEDSYDLKPVLRGKWQGGISNISSNLTQGGTYDPNIPYNSLQESLSGGVHSILYWVDKNNPRGLQPSNPGVDPQFQNWEYGVRLWAVQNGYN